MDQRSALPGREPHDRVERHTVHRELPGILHARCPQESRVRRPAPAAKASQVRAAPDAPRPRQCGPQASPRRSSDRGTTACGRKRKKKREGRRAVFSTNAAVTFAAVRRASQRRDGSEKACGLESLKLLRSRKRRKPNAAWTTTKHQNGVRPFRWEGASRIELGYGTVEGISLSFAARPQASSRRASAALIRVARRDGIHTAAAATT